MACDHWKECGMINAGECGLKLYGGEPSFGVCKACPENTTKGQWPTITHAPMMDPAVVANIVAQNRACRGCGDAPLDGL